jgi:hypothetical protein
MKEPEPGFFLPHFCCPQPEFSPFFSRLKSGRLRGGGAAACCVLPSPI